MQFIENLKLLKYRKIILSLDFNLLCQKFIVVLRHVVRMQEILGWDKKVTENLVF